MTTRERGAGSGLLRVAMGLLIAGPLTAQSIPQLPDSTGWGVHVLALARAPDSAIWAGTYGQGIFVLRPHATTWEHIAESDDTSKHSISWNFVHAFAFGPKGEVWYGTVGNGWGLSTDNGKTWKNWQYRELGPEWQYVAPNGIATRGDTTYIATADGIKVTGDDGARWAVITDSMGATTAKDPVIGRIRNQYVLAIWVGTDANMWISELTGIAHSPDGGRTWHERFARPPCREDGCANRARALQNRFTEGVTAGRNRGSDVSVRPAVRGVEVRDPRQPDRENAPGHRGVPRGYSDSDRPGWAIAATILTDGPCPQMRLPAPPAHKTSTSGLRHTWFRRPIDLADQPYIDQTYRFGSTMGGNFQAHQGVEFNNPDGTPVHAIGDGVVVYSGPAEAGANTVAIRHDRQAPGNPGAWPG